MWRSISGDLGLDAPFVKGKNIPVKNCWHFCTDGNAVDELFRDADDFEYGMNLIYIMVSSYKVAVLAFTLMDTHVHFVLYGEFDLCNRMMHEYLRRLSMYISFKYGIRNKLRRIPLTHQTVDTDYYLKTVICYTVKNAPTAGLPYTIWDYPWSSGSLYFRSIGIWTSPIWQSGCADMDFNWRSLRLMFHTQWIGADDARRTGDELNFKNVKMFGNLICPSEYVAVEIVEKIFRTHKSFNYFMNISKDSDVESRDGATSYLTIPMQEMRQHKNELCHELFGAKSLKELDTTKRLRLARTLKSRYNSSAKQIARLCGLVYEEIKDYL